jgi:hypothetical protein
MEVLRVRPGRLIYHNGERYGGGAIAPELTEKQKAYHAESLEVIGYKIAEIELTDELLAELEETFPDPIEPVIVEDTVEIPDPVELVDDTESIEGYEQY